jgi:hypothetical protein
LWGTKDKNIIEKLSEPGRLHLEAEARVPADLDTPCRGRTNFRMAHRLSTLRDVDRILVQDFRFARGEFLFAAFVWSWEAKRSAPLSG